MNFRHLTSGLFIVLAVVSCAPKEPIEAPVSRSLDPDRMKAYLIERAEGVTARALDGLDSREAVDARREEMRRKFRYMLGLGSRRERTPLNARVTGSFERPDYRLEKVLFESMPGFYVTGTLYIPKTGRPPYPTILYSCGHAINPYGAKSFYQHHGVLMSRNGYVTFIVDPIQIAEVYAVHHGVCFFDRWDWFSRGYNPSGVEVWNAIRALDYLETRPEVNSELIGMTGRSGGGTMSWFTGALDDRIKVVVTANASSTVESHVRNNLFAGHCDCAYFTNLYRFDWTTLAAMIAPRPLMLHNATEDPIYPPDGYKRVLEGARQIYNLYDVPERVEEVEIVAGHRDTTIFRLAALRWFNKWLLDKTETVAEGDLPRVSPDSLLVLDGNIPQDARNPWVQEEFIPQASPLSFKTRRAWEEKKNELMVNLREYVFRNLPSERTPLNLRVVNESRSEHVIDREIVFEPEPGIEIQALLSLPADSTEQVPAVVYLASPRENRRDLRGYFNGIIGRRITLAIYSRGTGPEGIWDSAFNRYARRSAYLMGLTLDTMRLWDLLRGIDLVAGLDRFDGADLTVAGKGELGIIGLYAGLLDDRIGRVVLHEPTESHNQGPQFLNVLRYTDVPDAACFFAPRPITFIGRVPDSFRKLDRVYDLLGIDEGPSTAVSLYHALQPTGQVPTPHF